MWNLQRVLPLVIGMIAGCNSPIFNGSNSSKNFVHLGNGDAVSAGSLTKYIDDHSVSREDAIVAIRRDKDSRRDAEFVKKYGISEQ